MDVISRLMVQFFGGEILTRYNEKTRDYSIAYAKENLKRVPLDLKKSDYEKLKASADAAGQAVNAYIKQAIDERQQRDAATPSIKE